MGNQCLNIYIFVSGVINKERQAQTNNYWQTPSNALNMSKIENKSTDINTNTQKSRLCCLCGTTFHNCHNYPQKSPRELVMGTMRVKKDWVPDTILLECEGYPTAKDSEYGVPDDKKNKSHAKVRLRAILHHKMTRYNPPILTLYKE